MSFNDKNILFKEKISQSSKYYCARMYDEGIKKNVIVDEFNNELLFLDDALSGIREINEDVIIIDYVSLKGNINSLHGSKLYKINDKAELIFTSNACEMRFIDGKLIGANFIDENISADNLKLDVEYFVTNINDLEIEEKDIISYENCLVKKISKKISR